MSQGTPISVPVGVDYDVQVSLIDGNGNPVTIFTVSDTPFAEIWSGSSTPVAVTPTCTWVSAPAGTFTLNIVGSTTTNLSPGKYRLRYGVKPNGTGQTFAAQDVFVEFTASPGSQAALSSYCTYQDMLNYAPWIGSDQDVTDETGFAVQRNKARQWLERIIQRHNPASYWNDFATTLFGYSIGGSDQTVRNWQQTDPVLQGYLDSNYLRVNEQVIEITAKYALYLVANAQVGPNDQKTSWQQLATDWYADAQREVKAYTAEIYLPGNTISPVKVIPCGRVTIR